MSTVLDAALELSAERGLPLVPCDANKKPLYTNWQNTEIRTQDQVEKAFSDPAVKLIGVLTGTVSGLIIIDIDPRNGGDAWYRDHFDLLDCRRNHRTRSDGYHLVYRMPDIPIRKSNSKLAPGVDVLADGAQMIWWPAHGGVVALDDEPGPLPVWLFNAIIALEKPAKANGNAPPHNGHVVEGGRNDHLTRRAGKLRHQGLTPAELSAALLVANQELCSPPLPDAEVRGIAASVARYAPAHEDRRVELPKPRELSPLVWIADIFPVLSQAAVVKNVISAGSFVLIYGESNSGKTFFATDLCLHIAGNQPWRGHIVRGGLVVYIAAEGGHGIRNRLAAYRQQAPWTQSVPFAVLPQTLDLLDPAADTQLLIDAIKAAEVTAGVAVAVVVLDTLARVIPGGNENASEDMSGFIANVDRIRTQTGAATLTVHHAGKDVAKGARGHSSLRAAADTEILVEGRDGTRTATVTKQRDLPSGQVFAFDLVPVEIGSDEDGQAVSSCVVAATDTPPLHRQGPSGKQQIAVLRLMEAEAAAGRPVLTTGDIVRLARERLGIAKSSARSAVLGLTEARFITPTIGGLMPAEGLTP